MPTQTTMAPLIVLATCRHDMLVLASCGVHCTSTDIVSPRLYSTITTKYLRAADLERDRRGQNHNCICEGVDCKAKHCCQREMEGFAGYKRPGMCCLHVRPLRNGHANQQPGAAGWSKVHQSLNCRQMTPCEFRHLCVYAWVGVMAMGAVHQLAQAESSQCSSAV